MARRRDRAWAGRGWLAGAVVLACLVLRTVTLAHVQPKPIEEWGPFNPGVPRCLRMISRETHACFDRVLLLLQGCNNALVRGQTCDMESIEDEITELTRPLHTVLTRECELGQLTELGYIGVPDAEADLFAACVSQARATVSATYAPALVGPPPEAAAECMVASAAYSRQVIRFILRQEVPVNAALIATRLFTKEDRNFHLLGIEVEMSASRPRWVTGLTGACPQFATIYGRSADSFLRTMKQRADCIMSRTYIHNLINCPGAVCGNGVPEPGEECDDGNRNDQDTCLTNCTLPKYAETE